MLSFPPPKQGRYLSWKELSPELNTVTDLKRKLCTKMRFQETENYEISPAVGPEIDLP